MTENRSDGEYWVQWMWWGGERLKSVRMKAEVDG